MNIFERILQNVPILEYMQAETGTVAKRTGKTHRLNPCPLCDNSDCMTVYDASFKCFSCDKAGDIINFEREYRKLGSNLEAAKSIAGKKGIEFKLSGDGCQWAGAIEKRKTISDEQVAKDEGQGTRDENKKEGGPEEPEEEPGDVDRGLEIREWAAGYYHDQLMQNPDALDIQVKKRKHSLDLLKEFRVGYSAGNIISHAKEQGYTVDELAGVGLVRKRGKSYSATISKGFFVYPHTSQGKVLYFTIKDPSKERSYQIQKKYTAPGWLCFGQDNLLHEGGGPVVVVEGENDLLSVCGKGGVVEVAATIGNYNTTNIIRYLEKNAKGKSYYLCFDNNDAGKKYTEKYTKAILGAGGDVRVVNFPSSHDDIDDCLRDAENPAELFQQLIEAAAVVEDEKVEAADCTDYHFKSFEVLGETEDERVVFWSLIHKRIYIVGLNDLKLDKLIQIGGSEVIKRVSRTVQQNKMLFNELKKWIIVKASMKFLGSLDRVGQGIHQLKNGLLIVNGGQAYVWDGKRIAEQDHPVVEGKLINWMPGYEWVDFKAVKTKLENMNLEKANSIVDSITGLFSQWGFIGKLDFTLATGWFLAQFLQSVWKWRPHLWVCGPTASGKTTMNQLLETLGGTLVLRCEGQVLTEPGLRQSIGDNSSLVLIDEFEKSEHRKLIIEFLRSAGRGGYITKGSANQKAMRFRIRHMVFVCSIERGIYRAAEKNRYVVIETKKDDRKQPEIPLDDKAAELREDILAYVLWIEKRVQDTVSKIGRIEGFDNRFIDALAVPFGMIAASWDDPVKSLRALLMDYLSEWSMRQEGVFLEDETKLIQDILMSHVRVMEEQEYGTDKKTIMVDRTVSQCIFEMPVNDDHRRALEASGIRMDNGRGLFVHPDTVTGRLLKHTQWEGYNIRDILARVPGAVQDRARMANQNLRGIRIPNEYLEKEFLNDLGAK